MAIVAVERRQRTASEIELLFQRLLVALTCRFFLYYVVDFAHDAAHVGGLFAALKVPGQRNLGTQPTLFEHLFRTASPFYGNRQLVSATFVL